MAQEEKAEDLKTQQVKFQVNIADIPEEMQNFILDEARMALERFTLDKDIAAFIKKAADQEFKTSWNVYCGRNFSSYITHDRNRFLDFSLGELNFEVFECDNNFK